MSELQSTIEFSVELFKFYNVDLFQRGMYQVRSSLRASSKLSVEIEVTTPEVTTGLGSAIVLGNYGACRPFQILYRNEEVNLKDVVLFRCHMLVDGNNLRESLERAEFSLILELWFSDTSPASMVMVSSRVLQLNMSPIEGLHYHLPVLFDYFHLSAISLTVHAALTALHQPSLKKGLLRYMQSCAPKGSKSWSKIRSAHCTSLTDPVLPVSSNKVYSRINETPQVHLEAYNVLLDSSNNLRSAIREYKHLLRQREEIVPENYDTLVVKHNEYDSTKLLKKRPHAPTSGLAELCADNIKLWNYFLLTFSCKLAIQQHLSKKHHHLRVKRFAELFFLVYNPRKSAFGCHESNYQNYLVIAEVARRSKYMQMLPPLPIHCIALDGESATMPVIFEDRYQDPFDHKRKTFKDVAECDPSPWRPKIEKIEVDSTNCSCGIGKLWETRKQLGKTLVNIDLYALEDQLAFAIPTRHSKSLDQLQVCSLDTFRHSLCNIRRPKGENGPSGPAEVALRRRQSTLVNVASEHDMRAHFQGAGKAVYESCGCTKNVQRFENAASDQSNGFYGGRFDLAELALPASSKLVKSASQTQPEGNASIFRSNSMRSFSPERVVTGVQKFNTLLTKKGFTERARGVQSARPAHHKKPQSKRRLMNGKRFDIGPGGSSSNSSSSSSSSSLEGSPTTRRKRTGPRRSAPGANPGVRRARSAPFLAEEATQPALSGTESLPNIISKLEERLYPEMRYYTSTSSATSEQSGWISSRSSSIASSTDATNPATTVVPIREKNQKKNACNADDKPIKDRREVSQSKPKLSLFRADSDSSNNGFPRRQVDFHSLKGCEANQSNISEVFALPPPKQFRDLESPSTSITNGTNEEEINAVDNLLYHVVDTTTTLEKRPSQFNLRPYNETEDLHFAKDNSESIKTFLKAKKEFKSQLNFPGLLYSDLDDFASTTPYFHISDEFRIFSPEGLHLVVCVHGLDGNSADLRLVKTYLELGLPGAYLDFLMSERNQGDTFSDFDTMTDRLISEILHYLDTSSIRPTRISFVGHSLGNIIIRSALTRPQMKFLLPRLHTFLSLSGPHLGTLYNSSGLVNMGMWFMQKWKKSGSLLQLCLKDSTDPRQSFLYRLSQRSTLHHFRNILLCGSGQDRYVPLHSARIELCKESLKDNTYQGKVYREMVHNILSPIIAEKKLKLLRYDIHHALPNTANALIGRAAHIAVLDSELFIEKFMVIVGIKYFR